MMYRAAFRLASWQVALVGLVAVLAGWLGGMGAALAAMFGGFIGIMAGLYQALRMFRVDAAADPEGFMRSVYVGEAVKIVLTVALFIVAIRAMPERFGALISGYAVTLVTYWVALKTNYPWLPDESSQEKTE